MAAKEKTVTELIAETESEIARLQDFLTEGRRRSRPKTFGTLTASASQDHVVPGNQPETAWPERIDKVLADRHGVKLTVGSIVARLTEQGGDMPSGSTPAGVVARGALLRAVPRDGWG